MKIHVTETGHIAMIPQGIKRSDIICSIWGIEVPFVLRPLDSVADGEAEMCTCYVHGMMDGIVVEFFPGLRISRLSKRILVTCIYHLQES